MANRGGQRFVWDAPLGRFRYATSGRLVPQKMIRDAIDVALERQRQRLGGITQQWRAGFIEASEWELEMRLAIKTTHLYTTAAAKGGWESLTQADYGRAGGHIAREYGFLRQFREAVESGAVPLDGRAQQRAESYAEAARRTYHAAEKEVRAEQGEDLVRNILHPADHCDECLALTDAGAMPSDEMPDPGDRECGNGCKCSLAYESSAPVETADVGGEE